MKRGSPKNVVASVQARLVERSRELGVEHQLTLARFGVERLQRGLQGRPQGSGDFARNRPLDDPRFRAALFEQLGESRLEPAVTTDIAGKDHAHAVRLDVEATPEIKKARLHRKVATTILFESNGGQQRGEATLPEVRLAVAEPVRSANWSGCRGTSRRSPRPSRMASGDQA